MLVYSNVTLVFFKILVVRDPFGANDSILRAEKANIPFQVAHNTSIINAMGCCGLQVMVNFF